jgi:endonuclease/exonuclease/phosphatase family metal-dependent hydrolase
MAWNVGHFPEPARDRAAAVLRAIDADVLLLDELGDDVASALEARLKSSAESRAAWRLTWGHGTGVVARGDVRKTIGKIAYPPGSLERVVDAVAPNQSAEQRRAVGAALDARGVTALGAVATLGARRLLAVTLGIQCCGGAAREERRMIEVRAIHDATRTALASDRPDAVLVGGDFNLVGTRNPLDTLATGLDRDGSSLAIVRALTFGTRPFHARPVGLVDVQTRRSRS